MTRNLTDEQVAEIGYDVVRDYLLRGIEWCVITEYVDESTIFGDEVTEDDPTDEDYIATERFVNTALTGLFESIDKP